jgi:phosphohistidine phosphatase SixA
MQLYLVQHGAAKTEAEDPRRGLTDEGRRTVEHMGGVSCSVNRACDRHKQSHLFLTERISR